MQTQRKIYHRLAWFILPLALLYVTSILIVNN